MFQVIFEGLAQIEAEITRFFNQFLVGVENEIMFV